MSSIRCPQCGLVNFASASECKRCHLKFDHSEFSTETSPVADPSHVDANGTGSLNPEPVTADYQKAQPAPLPEYFDAEPDSLNAPMVLFAVYLFLCAVVLIYQLTRYADMMGGKAWKHMIDPRDKLYISSLEPMIYFSVILHILGILASILLTILLLRRSYSFLRLVRVYLLGSFVYFAMQIATGLSWRSALLEKLPNNKEIEPLLDGMYWHAILSIIGFLIAFIWFRYFTTSDRVKSTFIN